MLQSTQLVPRDSVVLNKNTASVAKCALCCIGQSGKDGMATTVERVVVPCATVSPCCSHRHPCTLGPLLSHINWFTPNGRFLRVSRPCCLFSFAQPPSFQPIRSTPSICLVSAVHALSMLEEPSFIVELPCFVVQSLEGFHLYCFLRGPKTQV
jgi:hypothetical protein